MILFYLFDYFYFVCIVHSFRGTGTCGADPDNWYTLLTQEKKTIKFLTVCDFITSGTACSVLWNTPPFTVTYFIFRLFVLMLWRNKDQKGILVQSVSSSMGKETAKIQTHANVNLFLVLCLNGPQAAHGVRMSVLWCCDKHWVCLLFTTFPPIHLTLSSCFLHPRTWTHKLLCVE